MDSRQVIQKHDIMRSGSVYYILQNMKCIEAAE